MRVRRETKGGKAILFDEDFGNHKAGAFISQPSDQMKARTNVNLRSPIHPFIHPSVEQDQ